MKTEKFGFIEKIVRRGIYGVSALMVVSGALMMMPRTSATAPSPSPSPCPYPSSSPNYGEACAQQAWSDVVVTLNPVISLGVYSSSALTEEKTEVNLGTITPTALEPATAEGSAYVGVATNNASGYTLKMTMGRDGDTELETDLEPETSGINTKIAAGGASSGNVSDLAKDTWGYKGGALTTYTAAKKAGQLGNTSAIATTSGPNSVATGAAEGSCAAQEDLGCDAVQVTFGAKVSMDTVTGVYSNTVMFTAVANSI